MKNKIAAVLLAVLMALAGCGGQSAETRELKVLSPKGATAIGVMPYAKEHPEAVTTVDGTDALTAAFTEPQSEYDVIIAPVNLGGMLKKKEATEYVLMGVLTWGNLYLVSDQEASSWEGARIAAFGQNAVPDKILSYVLESRGETAQITWFNSTADTAASALSQKGEYDAWLLAEPAVSNVLAKDSSMQVVLDLQEEYGKAGSGDSYPQAGIFVRQEAYDADEASYRALMDSLADYSYDDLDALRADMDEMGSAFIGVSSQIITAQTVQRMNIHPTDIDQAEEDVEAFLQLFGISGTEGFFLDD